MLEDYKKENACVPYKEGYRSKGGYSCELRNGWKRRGLSRFKRLKVFLFRVKPQFIYSFLLSP